MTEPIEPDTIAPDNNTINNSSIDDIDNLVTFSTIAVSAPSIKSMMANLDASTYADIQEKLNNGVISITCK